MSSPLIFTTNKFPIGEGEKNDFGKLFKGRPLPFFLSCTYWDAIYNCK